MDYVMEMLDFRKKRNTVRIGRKAYGTKDRPILKANLLEATKA